MTVLKFVVAAIVGMAMTAGASAQDFTLKLHHFLSAKSPAHTEMLEPWAKRVEDASGGRVKIEIYPSMSLGGKPPQLIRQVRDRVVDLIWTVNGYTPGLFPRTEVFELPFIHTNDPEATDRAMAEMFDTDLAADYEGVKVMFLHVHAGHAIQTVDRLVRKPADMAGMTMRIPSRTGAWVLEALGATPVGMPVPDLPQALASKAVEGALIPWEIIPALKLQDQTQYQIEGADKTRFGTIAFQVSMNIDTWNSLPPEIQTAFLDNSGPDWWAEVGRIWRQTDDGGIKVAIDAGNEHIVLSAEETKVFQEALEPVVDRWVEDVTASGIDGAGLVAKAREAVKKHAK